MLSHRRSYVVSSALSLLRCLHLHETRHGARRLQLEKSAHLFSNAVFSPNITNKWNHFLMLLMWPITCKAQFEKTFSRGEVNISYDMLAHTHSLIIRHVVAYRINQLHIIACQKLTYLPLLKAPLLNPQMNFRCSSRLFLAFLSSQTLVRSVIRSWQSMFVHNCLPSSDVWTRASS